MMRRRRGTHRTLWIGLICAAASTLSGASLAQEPKSYTDSRKEVVRFPLGAASFADRVHSARSGSKKPLKTESDPKAALGEPDYQKAGDGRAYSLGCRGEVAFEFTDNAIIDAPGPDLYVFEVGQDVEPTNVSLSNNGRSWVQIGRIAGGKTSIDLADYGLAGRDFRFVRLQDTGRSCDGRWPGADIDAVGAIGSAVRLRLESKVLFEFDQDVLRADANAALMALHAGLQKLRYARIVVAGHTDSKGSDAYNEDLSRRRAQAVAGFLIAQDPQLASVLQVVGRGESEPIETNDTETGRAANRRVEVIIVPN